MPWTEADLLRHYQAHPELRRGDIQCPEMVDRWPPILLVLPYGPTTNHYWVPVGSRLVLSEAGKAYRIHVGTVVLRSWPRTIARPLTERLTVALALHPPDRRTRDIDNPIKPVLDALTHAGVWVDDNQVDELHIVRYAPVTPGYVQVTIQESSAPERTSSGAAGDRRLYL